MAAEGAVKMGFGGRVGKVFRRVLRSFLLIYGLVCLVMYALQTSLIFPGAATQGRVEARVKSAGDMEVVELKTPSATPIFASFTKGVSPPHHGRSQRDPAGFSGSGPVLRPTVLYFYGNAECMATADFVADRFGAMGCNVMLVDYAGFGMSGGKPSEEGCYEAAEAAYQYVLTRRDVDKTKLVAAGWSLGGAVAIDLAWRHRGEGTICGLMTFSSFTSMVDLAQHLYPVLPVGLVLKHRFMSVEKLREVKVPYFCGHGRGDSIVPFGFSGRLCAAAGCGAGGVTKFESGSDHNDFFDVEEERLNGAIGEFLGRVTGE